MACQIVDDVTRASIMKITNICAGTLLALAAYAVQAQTTVDVAKIALSKSIAVWLSGYYSGLRHDTVVDMGRMQQNIDKVQDFCRLNLEMPVMDAAKKALAASK